MNTRKNTTLLVIGIVLLIVIGGLWYVWHQDGSMDSSGTMATSTATSTLPMSGTVSHTTPAPVNTGPGHEPTPSSAAPRITSFVPAGGTPGTSVMIKGTGFDKTTNYISFGTSGDRHRSDGTPDNQIAVVGSLDGTTITFTVPTSGPSGLLCDSNEHCVAISSILLSAGNYPVTVRTKNGTSNSALFVLSK